MKKNASFKNIFDMLLGIFFASWLFLEIIILGNKFDIFWYDSLSGKLIVLISQVTPAVIVYMFFTVWKDIDGLWEFAKKILKSDGAIRTAIALFVFCTLHLFFCLDSGLPVYHKRYYIIWAVISAVCMSGLQEIAWRGFLQPVMWEKLPYFTACIMTGVINCIYCIPLWSVEGTRQDGTDYALTVLYCVFQGLLLGGLHRITGSVFACIMFSSFMQVINMFYDELMFGNSRIGVYYTLEMIAVTVAALLLGSKSVGKGWAEPEGDVFV